MKEDEMVRLFHVVKEDLGPNGGWSQAFTVSEYDIPKSLFLKYCKCKSKSEPEMFRECLDILTRKVKVLLGL